MSLDASDHPHFSMDVWLLSSPPEPEMSQLRAANDPAVVVVVALVAAVVVVVVVVVPAGAPWT